MFVIFVTVRACLCVKMVSYLLDLPEEDEKDEERPEINTPDSLWGETGTIKNVHDYITDLHYYDRLLNCTNTN